MFTNNTFTNVAFITFLPPDLSIPRIGTRETDLDNATRIEADIDLYVSTDASLTNLNPAAGRRGADRPGQAGIEPAELILGASRSNENDMQIGFGLFAGPGLEQREFLA